MGINPETDYKKVLKDISRQINAKEREHKTAINSPDLTPATLMDHARKYHYKDVEIIVVWQYGGRYGKTCKSIGIRRGDFLDLKVESNPGNSDSIGVSVYWKGVHIGYMKENRMQEMVMSWSSSNLPVLAVVSDVGGECKILVEFAFYGSPSRRKTKKAND